MIVAQYSLIVAVHEATFGLLGPAVAGEQMNGATDWGFIAASFGLGTFVGGILSVKIKPRYPMRFATLCTFTFCSLPIALSVPASVPTIGLAAFIEGMAGQVFDVLWFTTLQKKIPSHMLSRVSAYDHMGSIALAPLGIVASGFLFEMVGYRTTLLIALVAVFVPSVCAIAVRDVRMMTTDDTSP